jgi:hypothetical protein
VSQVKSLQKEQLPNCVTLRREKQESYQRTMSIGDNPFKGKRQFGCFLDLIEAGASVQEAAEITGITPEELAEVRAIDPRFDARMAALAPGLSIERILEILAGDDAA